MSKTININSVRLETALTKKFKTDRKKTISRALGFKDNALNEALRRGTISNKMAAALDKLGIDRRDYEEIALSEALGSKKDTSTSETIGRDTAQAGAKNDTPTQLSFDDLESMRRDELKSLIKEAIGEVLNSFSCKEIRGAYDPINRVYTVDFLIRGGD